MSIGQEQVGVWGEPVTRETDIRKHAQRNTGCACWLQYREEFLELYKKIQHIMTIVYNINRMLYEYMNSCTVGPECCAETVNGSVRGVSSGRGLGLLWFWLSGGGGLCSKVA